MNKRPNVLIAGAQKSGTTYLGRILSEHPDIFFLEEEVHFFSNNNYYSKGIDVYEELFNNTPPKKYIGEKTPNYLWVNYPKSVKDVGDSAERIHKHYPEIKIICILRNPVKRAVSAYNHHYRQGRISPLTSIDSYLTNNCFANDEFGILGMGQYFSQINHFLKFFEKKQLLILIYEEDLAKKPMIGINKCLDFLNLGNNLEFKKLNKEINKDRFSEIAIWWNYFLPTNKIPSLKKISYKFNQFLPHGTEKKPNSSTLEKLYNFYLEENQKLFKYLKRPNIWL